MQETDLIGYRLKQFRVKEVYKVQMKRVVLWAIIKICAEAILLSSLVGVVVGVIGNKNAWNTSIAYSNAFFVAGCLMIVAGGMTRLAAGQEWGSFHFIYAESFRNMSNSDRANFIINASSSYRLVLLGLLSGILLILAAVLVTKMF